MLSIVRVNGDSMQPYYRHNDYVLITSLGKKLLKSGQDVVCVHPKYGKMLKRISKVQSERIYLTGLNHMSTSQADLGFINSTDVVGKVIYHLQP